MMFAQFLELFVGQRLFLFLTKDRDPDVPPGIQVEVIDEVLQLEVGSDQAIVQ